MVQHGIEIQINRFVGWRPAPRCLCDQSRSGPGDYCALLGIRRRFRRPQPKPRTASASKCPGRASVAVARGGRRLAFRYRHPKLWHATEIRFSGSDGIAEKDGTVSWRLNLAPQQPVSLGVDVIPVFCEKPVTLRHGRDAFAAVPGEATSDGGLRMTACNEPVQRAWDRAVSDLASLALLEGEGVARRTPAAGVPKYLALFGRDVLNTAFQAGFLAPEMLRGPFCASPNGMPTNTTTGTTKPGRVIHQRQLGPLALLEKTLSSLLRRLQRSRIVPDRPGLGSGADRRQGILSVDAGQSAPHPRMDGSRRRRDGDGFYEYATKAGSWGEKNQGWKDFRRRHPLRGWTHG